MRPLPVERVVPAGAHNLRCHEFGSGPAVLLLNGAGAATSLWDPAVCALLASDFRVVTMEYPYLLGPEAEWFAELCQAVAGVLDFLDEPVDLVGFSLGAFVAQELARTRSDSLRSLTLIGTRGRTDHFRNALIDAALASIPDDGRAADPWAATSLAMQYLAPQTLADDHAVADWLSLFELSASSVDSRWRQHLEVGRIPDGLTAWPTLPRGAWSSASSTICCHLPSWGQRSPPQSVARHIGSCRAAGTSGWPNARSWSPMFCLTSCGQSNPTQRAHDWVACIPAASVTCG